MSSSSRVRSPRSEDGLPSPMPTQTTIHEARLRTVLQSGTARHAGEEPAQRHRSACIVAHVAASAAQSDGSDRRRGRARAARRARV